MCRHRRCNYDMVVVAADTGGLGRSRRLVSQRMWKVGLALDVDYRVCRQAWAVSSDLESAGGFSADRGMGKE